MVDNAEYSNVLTLEVTFVETVEPTLSGVSVNPAETKNTGQTLLVFGKGRKKIAGVVGKRMIGLSTSGNSMRAVLKKIQLIGI